MDDMLIEQLGWLISGNPQGSRLAKNLQILCGCLAGAGLPENIRQQLDVLSRQMLLQDVFDALVNSLNQFSKTMPSFHPDPAHRERGIHAPHTMEPLIAQIEQARRELSACDVANQGVIIAWVVGQAKEQKLWGRAKRR